jgi:hypothetical protein
MKYLMDYKMFESLSSKYKRGDKVVIKYYLTGDLVPVKILEDYGRKGYLVSFNVEGNPFQNSPNMRISKKDVVRPYKLTNDPVTFHNPLNIPNDFIRRDMIRISNDIQHYNVF